MYKQPFFLLSLLLIAGLLAACRLSPGSRELARAEKRWQAQPIDSYQIEVLVVNSTWHAQYHLITVRDGEVVDSSARCIPAPAEMGKCEVREYTADDYTVPGLFSKARTALTSIYARFMEVDYEPTYSFPNIISYSNPEIIDGGWMWRVTSFTPQP